MNGKLRDQIQIVTKTQPNWDRDRKTWMDHKMNL